LHRSACVGVTSCEKGSQSQVSRKEENGVLLEMLISEVEKIFVLSVLLVLVFWRTLCLLFYRVKWRPRGPKSPKAVPWR
jgi:hypothetical protein